MLHCMVHSAAGKLSASSWDGALSGLPTCDFSCHEQLVDVLQESLVLDLCIREQEADRLALEASNLVQALDVLQQVGDIVGLRQNRARNDQGAGPGSTVKQYTSEATP